MVDDPVATAGVTRFAQIWAASLAGTSYLPMPHAKLEAMLAGLTVRIVEALRHDPFEEREGQEIGAALVAAHVTSAEGIGRTVKVINSRLLPDLGLPPRLRDRLADLLGAVTTGYTRALRDRTLDEQEAIRRAALLARERAELALRESEARFRYQANHDPLTDLANRTLFTEQLARLYATEDRTRRLGICFVDLDGFKLVNDTLGHHIGDLLLMTVADRLRQRVPEHLIARLGGDEFVVLVKDTTCADDVIKVADAVLAAIAEPARVDGHELIVSASIGIIERSVSEGGPGDILRAADITLQWAKNAGKGRWALFESERHERELARYALSAAMPAALDRGEFFLEYQPLVSLRSQVLRGVEALVRWDHLELGILHPDRFIGLAEETGLIVRLGARVLAEACRQARYWESITADPPYVSVNLAVRQMRDPALLDTVTSTLAEHGLAPDRLQLEITESAVVEAESEPVRTLSRLADLGVRIAIDDFGTGYSNLAYLRQLPVRELKVAGPFVTGLREPASEFGTDEKILATMVSLAHTLGLTVTAERVETAHQAKRLRALGCDAGQGWYFGRPMSPAALARWLAA